jgi:hypothetical protein
MSEPQTTATGDPAVHPETASPVFRYDPWFWREPSHGEHFRTCSFCGSINPDDLAAETGWRAEWADQKYGWPHKFYVDIANRDPEALFAIRSTWGATAKPFQGEVLWDELTEEQRAIYDRDHGVSRDDQHPVSVGFGTRSRHHAKFYTIHLSDSALDPAVKRTIELRSGRQFGFADGRVTWRLPDPEGA